MSEYALRLANSQDTAARVRAADALGMAPNGTVRARGGLRPDGGGVVTVVGGTMSVQCTAFSCWVDASPAGQVGYPFVCDATKTLAIDPGDPTLVRVDTVAVVIKENAFDGSGATTATLQIVKGTPGAGAPAMPTSACIPVRDISVHAGASAGSGGLTGANLSTDRRVYTVAAGGVLPCTSDPASPYEGQCVYRTDTDQLKVYDGTTWHVYDTGYVAYALTPTNFTVSNGTVVARSHLSGKSVDLRVSLAAGGSSSAAGAMSFSLPYQAHASGEQFLPVKYFNGTNFYIGYAIIAAGASTASFKVVGSAGAGVMGDWGTFTSGTVITIEGSYERA